MKQLILLLLTIAHGGHWLAGHTENIVIAWPAQSGLPASVLHWQLKMGSISLATGVAEMPDAAHPATVKITAPQVRGQTSLRFSYTLTSKKENNEPAAGETEINIYPDQVMGDFSLQYASRRIMLLDHTEPLRKLIEAAKISVNVIPDLSRIAMDRPDVLIVAPDEWPVSPLAQPALDPLATAGTQIILLRQSNADRLGGYRVSNREPAIELIWRADHPLLDGFNANTLTQWAGEAPSLAVQLPADEPALEIGYWKPETMAELPSPIDALLVSKTIGNGRIILCQIPAGDWSDDPRSQILLRNLLAYAATRPEPTPPPSRRRPVVQPALPRERNITISPGAQP